MGTVIKRLEEESFTLIDGLYTQLTIDKAEGFYAIHKERPFFGDLIEFMTSGPVFVMQLEHENAIKHLREVIGATGPEEADPETIRGQLAESKQNNLIHASDSEENAEIEINYFFT